MKRILSVKFKTPYCLPNDREGRGVLGMYFQTRVGDQTFLAEHSVRIKKTNVVIEELNMKCWLFIQYILMNYK